MGTLSRLRRQLFTPLGLAGAVGPVALLALAVLAPILWGEQAGTSVPTQISQPPSQEHIFGTDAGGRDILLRTLVATRRSVLMAIVAVLVGVSTGVLLGTVPLLLGHRLGRTVVAVINIGVAFPGLLLAIAFTVILGQNAVAATFAIAFAMAPSYGRLTYTLGASAWGRDYVSAARVLGVSRPVIVARHVLPNIRDPLLVNATISAGLALVAFAGLSFLGLGVQAPDYDWGRMLNEGLGRIFVTPAAALAPGVAIILAGLVFTLAGEALSRALTPGETALLRRRRPRVAEQSDAPHAGAQDEGPSSTGPGARHPVQDAVLRVRDLRISVPTREASADLVRGVSFEVGRGEMVGVVGESGSGKSLTLMSVAGLIESPLEVSAAQLVFDDQVLPASADGLPRRLARKLGTRMSLVFQDPMSSLNPALTVGSQVAEVGQLHEGLRRRASRDRAVRALVGAQVPNPERRYGQYPHELSGGLRQRVMIAMGLMGTPALLLADEPTTALDVTVQAEILDLLRHVNRTADTAVLFVSHDIAVVASLCSRVLVMYRGKIVETISTADLRAGRARHPYTRALLATVPMMSTDRSARLASIPEDTDFDGGAP